MSKIQLVIEIDEEEYRQIVDDNWFIPLFVTSIFKRGVPLPKNSTNGDMIKTLYPSIVIRVVTESQIGISFFNNQSEITWIPID